ncbi:MAG: ABC transporter ATP-binding protein [Candidatus Hermodarchaeota archaeon]|nr:ABC transporter ATP-binding protein [Candidatus Hermodarchaeota archaeon]
MPEDIIVAQKVQKEYRRGREIIHALRDISLTIRSGEFLVIEGKSGCGKTTLLNVLSGLDRPTDGRIIFDQMDLTVIDERILPKIRQEKIGFIFQLFNLISTMTVYENVAAPLWPTDLSRQDIEDKAMDVIRAVDMVERKDHIPRQLSGGEQQRTAIARALVNKPKVVFADEPTGDLDTKTGATIMQLLRKLNQQEKITFVVVTHDQELIKYADRHFTMSDGRLSGGRR